MASASDLDNPALQISVMRGCFITLPLFGKKRKTQGLSRQDSP